MHEIEGIREKMFVLDKNSLPAMAFLIVCEDLVTEIDYSINFFIFEGYEVVNSK